VVFAKGGHYALKELSQLNYNVIGIDWTIDPKVARQQVKPDTVLQGNLDPCALFGSAVYQFWFYFKLKGINYSLHLILNHCTAVNRTPLSPT